MDMMLLNARRRRRKGAKAGRKARRSTTARRTRSTRRKGAKAAAPRRTRRTRRTRGVRRTRRAARRGTRRVSVRGGRTVTLSVRNPRRRGGRGGLGNITGELRSLFNKENLTVAAGGVAATIVTQYLLNYTKEDGKGLLPMPDRLTDKGEVNPTAKAAAVAYAVGIPFVGALVTRRFSPGLSRGMLLGALINGITVAFQSYAPDQYASLTGTAEKTKKTEATKMYLDSVNSAGYMPTNRMSGVGVTFGPGFSKAF